MDVGEPGGWRRSVQQDTKGEQDPHAAAAERARRAVAALRAPNTPPSVALVEVEAAMREVRARLDSLERS